MLAKLMPVCGIASKEFWPSGVNVNYYPDGWVHCSTWCFLQNLSNLIPSRNQAKKKCLILSLTPDEHSWDITLMMSRCISTEPTLIGLSMRYYLGLLVLPAHSLWSTRETAKFTKLSLEVVMWCQWIKIFRINMCTGKFLVIPLCFQTQVMQYSCGA